VVGVPATIGLYHPFIHFRDDAWLKRSALYWDRMARIVPPSYQTVPGSAVLDRDSSVTRQLIDELNYVVNIAPVEVTYPVSSVFTTLLIRHAEQLRRHYDVTQSATWAHDVVTRNFAQLRNPALAYVHSAKLDDYLIQQLQEARLGVAHNENGQLWVGMHPRVANVYMAALAEELATVNRFSPTTSEPVDHVAALGWGLDRLTAALLDEREILEGDAYVPGEPGRSHDGDRVDPEVPAMLALIAVGVPVPADAASLPVAKIVEIRRRYGPELLRFQTFATAFVRDRLLDLDPAQADPEAVRAHLQVAYEHEIRPLLTELKRALRGHGVDTVEAAMGTSIVVPPALQPLGAPEPVMLGAAAMFSLLPVLRARRRAAQQAYRDSPVGYLLRLEEDFTPQTMPARVARAVRRFTVGV
jgi:hypothetical protein